MVYFGAVLCLLLVFFAVERRVAAYPPPPNAAAVTTTATGVQEPERISFVEPHILEPSVLFACVLILLAGCNARVWCFLEPRHHVALPELASTPLAVRPPPTL